MYDDNTYNIPIGLLHVLAKNSVKLGGIENFIKFKGSELVISSEQTLDLINEIYDTAAKSSRYASEAYKNNAEALRNADPSNLDALNKAVDLIDDVNGNSLIIENYLLNNVLNEVSKPFISFVLNWIKYGEIQDPYDEFFVKINDNVKDDDIWNLKYQLKAKNVPNFIKREKTIIVVNEGKVLLIIKFCIYYDYIFVP